MDWENINQLTKKYGQANRTYPVSDGYKNYVFKKKNQYYIVSVKDNQIKSVYATGNDVNMSPLHIGEENSKIYENTSINPEPTIKSNGKVYEFELSDEDLKRKH